MRRAVLTPAFVPFTPPLPCITAARGARVSTRVSTFCRPLRRRHALLPPRQQPHTAPRSHMHCGHAAHAHPPAQSNTSPTTPLASLQLAIARIRQSPTLAAAGALLLAAAAALHLISLTPLSRLPLYTSVLLTGLPALSASTFRVAASRGAAVDVDVLMSLAAAVCVATGAVFEGALLSVLYAVSHAAEDVVQRRARRALDGLRDAAPSTAWRIPSARGPPTEVPVEDVRIGDLVLVRAGELVPCDGVVAEGAAFLSMQVLTGEATPRPVREGDPIPAGARAEDAPIVVRVTEVGAESSMARIARLVTAAQENRPKVTRFFDRFGRLYARAVLVVSGLLAALLPALSALLSPLVKPVGFAGRSGSAARALGFLVAASPCALLIGGPVAYLAALSCCASKGVLAKSGAKSLEAASRATHVVFDKTGTLTTGKLTLKSAATLTKDAFAAGLHMPASTGGNGVSMGNDPKGHGLSPASSQHLLDRLKELEHDDLSRVVGAAAALERGAVHPIATAVQERATQLGGQLPDVSEPKVIAGQGVEGVLSFDDENGDLEIATGRLGRPSYILGKSAFRALSHVTEEASSRGETVSVLEIGSERYLLRLRDEVREESLQVMRNLKEQGLAISVLTGDGEGAAQFVSSAVGGGVEIVSNATPEEKLNYVTALGKHLSEKNSGVLMVGDGVNDAAALAASLVGVACGLSSATAVHAADVVLVREDLHNVGWFLSKARATQSIVRQNLIIALGLMVLATGACIGGAVPLWLAVTLHEGGTILVGINGLRLLRER